MRVLVLTGFPPRSDANHGGSRWTAGLINALTSSHGVGLLTLRRPGEEAIEPRLADRCELAVEVERVPARASLRNAWQERQRVPMTLSGAPGWAVGFSVRAFHAGLGRAVADYRPDLIHVESPVMAQYTKEYRDLPVVVVDQDPDDATASMRRFRRHVLQHADAVVVFTERDRGTIRDLVPSARVERIPLAIDLPEAPLDPVGNGRDVLFVGNFMHEPNVAAAERLTGAIFPRITARRPDARLVIVGPDPPASVRVQSSDRVVVTGEVADLGPLVDAAAVVVAPLSSGAGMRVKVLDALAAGKALVASPIALEGVDVRDGTHALVAIDDASFADAVVSLLEEAERRAALGRAARAWAEANLAWEPIAAAYDGLYRSLVER